MITYFINLIKISGLELSVSANILFQEKRITKILMIK
jgi:hypothetical protein